MYRIALGVVVLVGSFVCADHPAPPRKAVLMDGLSKHHHPVPTKKAEAQKFFDQGLRLIYAFNHDEAKRSFERAAELDPDLAMAYWGIALSVGPNYNLDAQAEALKTAYAAIQKALKLSNGGPEPERDYIVALSKRYAENPGNADKKSLALDYKNAMAELAKKYPDDLDAATLYAESMMNLRPWELWSADAKPAEGTEEIIAVLEDVLRRNPEHIGANHYYIHAVEASPTPERGLAAANRLGVLAPAAGHLVHMPSHIYSRVGDYAASAKSNAKAIAVDREYIKKFNVQGVYSMMYYSHNMHFLAVANAMQGRYKDARKAADDLAAHVGPQVAHLPMLEGFLPTPLLIDVRFRRWQEVLDYPAPNEKLVITRMLRHFARGLALTNAGKIGEARDELTAFRVLKKTIPDDAKFGERNKARHVFIIPDAVLEARIALAEKDTKTGIILFQAAVQAEDTLAYMEPPDWHLPVREMLGAVLLRANRPADAEQVFRADLERNRRNPRSLFGLRESLKAQGKDYAAQMVDQQFRSAWRNADVAELRVEDL
jgi:tetratricopeptide (TPR) repeat protein